MITVAEALARVFALVSALPTERVALGDAHGRVLARDVIAQRDQPPFPASAMDGYAVDGAEAVPGAGFKIIGESRAGDRFDGAVTPGTAVRIFTGAPVPPGADRVIIQEDVTRKGDRITLGSDLDTASYVRPAGNDFAKGHRITAGRRLSAHDIGLIAAMNVPEVTVHRRPVVAIMATGDELVNVGETPGPDQIIASNSLAIKAILESEGAETRLLPIARDRRDSLELGFRLAAGADMIVTTGGASVGDHDLVGPVAEALGMDLSFYKIAMRPGKPLLVGTLKDTPLFGLPGNPVSGLVCAHIFLRPALRVMTGLPAAPLPEITLPLGAPVTQNGPRLHYMRARIENGAIFADPRQDSSLMSVLADANALLIRPIKDRARETGEMVQAIHL